MGGDVSIRRGNSFSLENQAQKSAPAPAGEASGGGKTKIVARIFDAVITASLFLIFLGVPVFFTGLSYQGIVFEKQIYFYFFLLLALVAWAAKGVVSGELKIRRTPLDIPIGIFWLVYLLATVFSIDRWHSFWGFFGDPSRGLMSVTALIIAYYLAMSHLNEKRMKLVFAGFIGAGILLCLWTALGILGVKFLPQSLLNVSPLSLIGSVSGAGAIFSALIPLLITAVFMVQSGKNMSAIWKNTLTGILLAGLILDMFLILALYNFIPWIALLIGLGFFLIYILARLVRPIESWTWLPMAVFVLAMAVLMIGAVNITRVNLPVEVSPAFGISSEVAKDAFKSKFVLGSGPATYGYDFSLYRPQNFNENYFYNLRFYQGTGLIAEAVPTLGVLGSIALVLVILSYLSVGVYLLTREKERNKVYSLGMFSAMIMFIVFAATMRTEGTILIIGSLFGTLALSALLRESGSEEKNLNLTLKASPKYALALAFIFMVVTAGVAYLFVFVGKTFAADLEAGVAVRQEKITEDGSIGLLVGAINLYSGEGRYFTRIGQEYMALANEEMLKGEGERNPDLIVKYLNNSIAASEKGRELMKKDVLAVESLAVIYENAGLYVKDSLTKAEETYKEAQALEPHNPNYFVKLGQIKIAMVASETGEKEKKALIEEAKGLFENALSEKKNFAAAYYQLSLAKEALGDIGGAIEDMKQAFTLERSNMTYAFNLGRLFQTRGEGDDNKNAENLFKQILGVNDKEINTHFSLGLLYEKTSRKNEAVNEYKKVLELLPAGSGGAKEKVQKMIENIQNGVSNFTPNSAAASVNPAPAAAEEPSQTNAAEPAFPPR